jgi:hypothetical protein
MTAHIEIVPAVVDRIKQPMVGLEMQRAAAFHPLLRDHAGVKPSEFRRVARLGSDGPALGA